jgi:hypothetical protein
LLLLPLPGNTQGAVAFADGSTAGVPVVLFGKLTAFSLLIPVLTL